LPQETKLETVDGEIFREAALVHEFSLSYQERYDFYVVFTPQSGIIGETVMVVGTAIFHPSFVPESADQPFFGISHSMTSAFPIELEINHEIEKILNGNSMSVLQPISQEILDAEVRRLDPNIDLALNFQHFPRVSIFPNEAEFQLIYEGIVIAENGRARLTFLTYGGEESLNRITFFVNHKSVQVNGYDFIEVQMEHGKMLMIDVDLTLDSLDAYNTIYALMMAAGSEYEVQDVFKTPTLLLVNE